jgi:hypothetical protein
MGTGNTSAGVKQPEREGNRSLPSYKLNVKVKLSLYFLLTEQHTMKAYSGSGNIAPLIL